jgi:hypothetical protein
MANKQLITLENQTSPGTISPSEFQNIAKALSLQIAYDYNTSPWVEHFYAPPAEVKLLTTVPPKNTWNIILIDDTTVQGALGFHEDIGGGKIPVSYVSVKETREDRVEISEVVSHEAIEMCVNSFVTNESEMRTVTHLDKKYVVEVADPVQGNAYKVANGQLVADFVWPKWFGMAQVRSDLSQRDSIKNPFELAPEGYISILENNEWKQIYGEKRSKLPPWASRLPRMGVA